MSLFDVTDEVKEVLRQGPIEVGEIADIYLDDGVLHYSNMHHAVNVETQAGIAPSYIPLGDRLIPPDSTEQNQSLGDTAIDIFLDSSRATDPLDPVGALLDRQLVQRRTRLMAVLFRPDTNRTDPLWIFNVRDGVIDGVKDRIRTGQPSRLNIRIASGTFAYLERRRITYSDAFQRELFAGDTGFQHIPQIVDVNLPWRGEFG